MTEQTPPPAAARAPSAPAEPWTDPAARPLIEFDGVIKRFGEFTALRDINLSIYPGEFFALLGPSGCGKTTLMRMLAGFEDPTEGAVRLAGEDLSGLPPNKRPVNMMFQSYALFPHLSVADNIAFGLRREPMDKAAVAERTAEMVALVQLSGMERRKPHQLSGGQRQRVALARALAKRPKVLLLDEPLGALDKKLREETQFELVNIQEKLGATFLIVTHDQEEAMTVASRIAVMKAGEVAQVATPRAIYESPASRYVADFIGEANFFEGAAEAGADGLAALTFAEGQPPLKAVWREGAAPGPYGVLAVRPEKITIAGANDASAPPPGPQENRLSGVIHDIGYVGAITTYHVRLDAGGMARAQESNRRRDAGSALTWEDPVTLSWDAAAGVLMPE